MNNFELIFPHHERYGPMFLCFVACNNQLFQHPFWKRFFLYWFVFVPVEKMIYFCPFLCPLSSVNVNTTQIWSPCLTHKSGGIHLQISFSVNFWLFYIICISMWIFASILYTTFKKFAGLMMSIVINVQITLRIIKTFKILIFQFIKKIS